MGVVLLDYGWLLAQAVAALAALTMAVAVVARRPVVGLILLASLTVIEWEFPRPPALGSVLGFSIYLSDAILVVLVGALVVNVARHRMVLRAVHVALLVLTLTLVVSLARGLVGGDTGTVVVESREFLLVTFGALWAFSVQWPSPEARRRTLLRFASVLGVLLVLVGIYHGAVYGFGSADDLLLNAQGETVRTGRIFFPNQTLMLGACAMAVLSLSRPEQRRRALMLATLFGVFVILSQQRTAILGLTVGVLLMFARTRPREKVVAAALGALGAVVLVVAFVAGLLDGLLGDLAESATSTGTYEGRVGSWNALIASAFAEGSPVVTFGEPFGSGYGRFEGAGRWVEFAPHNFYLSIFLRAGIIGLLATVWLAAAWLRTAWGRRGESWAIGVAGAMIVFGWSYSWGAALMPFFILALDTPMLRPVPRRAMAASPHRRVDATADELNPAEP